MTRPDAPPAEAGRVPARGRARVKLAVFCGFRLLAGMREPKLSGPCIGFQPFARPWVSRPPLHWRCNVPVTIRTPEIRLASSAAVPT